MDEITLIGTPPIAKTSSSTNSLTITPSQDLRDASTITNNSSTEIQKDEWTILCDYYIHGITNQRPQRVIVEEKDTDKGQTIILTSTYTPSPSPMKEDVDEWSLLCAHFKNDGSSNPEHIQAHIQKDHRAKIVTVITREVEGEEIDMFQRCVKEEVNEWDEICARLKEIQIPRVVEDCPEVTIVQRKTVWQGLRDAFRLHFSKAKLPFCS